jgi:hypothetical protein
MKTLAIVIGIAALGATAWAQSPAPPPQRIKGTITDFVAPVLTVKTTDGKSLSVTLLPDARVIANQKIRLSDIKPNDFVASAADLGPDGKLHAEEVRVFPDSMRGLGEGQYPMDKPERRMTNATVVEVAGAARAKTGVLKLTFHGSTAGANGGCTGHASGPGKGTCTGTTEIEVGPKVPVMMWVLGDTSWLEKGKAVSLFTLTGADGKLSTHGVIVEHNGVKPLI